MFKHAAMLVIALAFAATAQAPPAQAPPSTDVYLVNLGVDAFPLTGGAPLNLSNSPGYDNQPSFLPDGKSVLFSSNRDGKQSDIYRYDLASKALTQLTRTPESEYSPLPTPDGKTFSVVRVEADNTQRLWRFDLDGANPRLVLDDVKPVGYHVCIDATHLGLFVLGAQGQPNTLQLADTTTGKAEIVASNIGRCLLMRPGKRTMTFVSKQTTPWMIKELDPTTRAISDVAAVLDGSEDFTWDPSRPDRVFMARGSKFYFRSGEEWRETGDFVGVGKITRLAIGPAPAGQPRLALVGEPLK